jgi:FAD dependent oxidoreductase TIGR03364
LSKEAKIWANPCGSIHLAHRADEWDVLSEFHALAPRLGYPCELLSPTAVCARSPAAKPDGLFGGLYSPTELGVNPRVAIHGIPLWLAERWKVVCEFGTTITQIEGTRSISGDGRAWQFDRIIVCGGSDFETLFPDILANSGLRRCKLQMLQTNPQPHLWRMRSHLASGLTLRHYKNFQICSSLDNLKKRIAAETPELDQYGIHVMASQVDDGAVVLGDSHEYGDEIEPFDKSVIDELILRELRHIVHLPEWKIAQRWHGIYAKHPTLPIVAAEPHPNVFIRFGPGGAGMTMAFGLAERDWEQWD